MREYQLFDDVFFFFLKFVECVSLDQILRSEMSITLILLLLFELRYICSVEIGVGVRGLRMESQP